MGSATPRGRSERRLDESVTWALRGAGVEPALSSQRSRAAMSSQCRCPCESCASATFRLGSRLALCLGSNTRLGTSSRDGAWAARSAANVVRVRFQHAQHERREIAPAPFDARRTVRGARDGASERHVLAGGRRRETGGRCGSNATRSTPSTRRRRVPHLHGAGQTAPRTARRVRAGWRHDRRPSRLSRASRGHRWQAREMRGWNAEAGQRASTSRAWSVALGTPSSHSAMARSAAACSRSCCTDRCSSTASACSARP